MVRCPNGRAWSPRETRSMVWKATISGRKVAHRGQADVHGRKVRPHARRRLAVTSHDRVPKKAGQNLDDVRCDPALFLRRETP